MNKYKFVSVVLLLALIFSLFPAFPAQAAALEKGKEDCYTIVYGGLYEGEYWEVRLDICDRLTQTSNGNVTVSKIKSSTIKTVTGDVYGGDAISRSSYMQIRTSRGVSTHYNAKYRDAEGTLCHMNWTYRNGGYTQYNHWCKNNQ